MSNIIERMRVFWQESRQELKRVNWPTREETIRYTLFVVGFSIFFAIFLGIIDYGFVRILEKIIS
ncbi:MAG: preprotein translocase subunit SecE [bacterium]|nr:preprotein translocase subunit SecE [Candidatus Jorgensenbacteria bacterium]